MNKKRFSQLIDSILDGNKDNIEEGMILNISKIISDTIMVPEGDYIVAALTSERCVLIPKNESGQQKFEVFRPTLSGFFNPEVHTKEVSSTVDGTILDSEK